MFKSTCIYHLFFFFIFLIYHFAKFVLIDEMGLRLWVEMGMKTWVSGAEPRSLKAGGTGSLRSLLSLGMLHKGSCLGVQPTGYQGNVGGPMIPAVNLTDACAREQSNSTAHWEDVISCPHSRNHSSSWSSLAPRKWLPTCDPPVGDARHCATTCFYLCSDSTVFIWGLPHLPERVIFHL